MTTARQAHKYLVRYVQHGTHWDVQVPAIGQRTTVDNPDCIGSIARQMLAEQGAGARFELDLTYCSLEPAGGLQDCESVEHDGLTRWCPADRQRPQATSCGGAPCR